MLTIGITGSFGAGKSTVTSMFRKNGACVIDADELVHEILAKDRRTIKAIQKCFGTGVVGSGGIDRKALGRIVFDDIQALQTLESIVHPVVSESIHQRIRKCGKPLVVIDAAVLLEAGWGALADIVVVVKANKNTQLKRIMARTGLAQADVLKRWRRQMPLKEKIKHADFVVDNSGTKTDTYKQVQQILRRAVSIPSRRIM